MINGGEQLRNLLYSIKHLTNFEEETVRLIELVHADIKFMHFFVSEHTSKNLQADKMTVSLRSLEDAFCPTGK